MVKVVCESSLHDCLVGLLSQDKSILFIVAVPFDLINLLHLPDSLELVGLKVTHDIGLFLLAFILVLRYFVFCSGNIWIDLVKILFLIEKDSAFKDLILTGWDVGHPRIDHHLLLVFVNEGERIIGLINTEVFTVDVVVDIKLLYLVFGLLANKCAKCPIGIRTRIRDRFSFAP